MAAADQLPSPDAPVGPAPAASPIRPSTALVATTGPAATGKRRRRFRWGGAALLGLAALNLGCSDGGPEVGSFCDELRQAPSLASVLTGFADQDPAQLEARLEEAEEQYGDLRVAAPDEIAPDVDRTVDLVDAVIAVVRADRDDPEAAAAAVRDVLADHTDAETSGLAVADYAQQECGVDLNPSLSTSDEGIEDDEIGEEPPPETDEDGTVTGGM